MIPAHQQVATLRESRVLATDRFAGSSERQLSVNVVCTGQRFRSEPWIADQL
jgi:hypothetical protein